MTKSAETRLRSKAMLMERLMVGRFRDNLKLEPNGGTLLWFWRLGYEAAKREMKRKGAK